MVDTPDGARIVAALGGKFHRGVGKVRCLCCGTNALKVEHRVGKPCLVYCFAGCTQWAVLDSLREAGLWPDRPDREERHPSAPMHAPPSRSADDEEADRRRRIEFAKGIWNAAAAIGGTPAEKYLRSRGIRLELPPTLRFVPALRHSASGAEAPALVGAVQQAGKVTGIQRIWLKPDGSGKAALDPAKATLGVLGYGAVRLGKVFRTLGVAEGIETALSARQIFKLPVWAVLGCGRLGQVVPPEGVERIVIFADTGKAGQEAAARAANHYGEIGYDTAIETPDGAVSDWNDVLRASA